MIFFFFVEPCNTFNSYIIRFCGSRCKYNFLGVCFYYTCYLLLKMKYLIIILLNNYFFQNYFENNLIKFKLYMILTLRASSIAASDSHPYTWVLECGFPKYVVKYGIILSNTLGSYIKIKKDFNFNPNNYIIIYQIYLL